MGALCLFGGQMIDITALVHAQAHVDDNVTIGARSRIWQFASVIRGAQIGAGCNVASCAIIDGARLGDRCAVGHGVSIPPGIWIGDEVFIGPGVVFCNDVWPSVSKDGFDMASFLAGDVTIRVDRGANIGAGAIILPGVVIGAGSTVAAGCVVRDNVIPNHVLRRDGRLTPPDGSERPRMRIVL